MISPRSRRSSVASIPLLMAMVVAGVTSSHGAAAGPGTVPVQVEVVQNDTPVTGLQAEDFMVRDKGKAVPVDEAFEIDPQATDVAIPDEAYRRIHLLFDLDYGNPRFLMHATDVARSLITPERLSRTEVSIATHEPGSGLRIEIEPTDSPKRLSEMLDTLRAEQDRRLDTWSEPVGPTVSGDDLITSRVRNTESAKGVVQQEQGRILNLIRSLSRLERQYRWVPGGTQVVLFSPGFDSSVVLGNQATARFDAAWAAERSEAAATGNFSQAGGATRYHGGLVEEAMFEMLSDYDRAGTRIEAVEIELEGELRPAERGARGTNGLQILAGRTNGMVLKGTREELTEKILDLEPTGALYLLTFEPRSLDSGRYRKLDVKLQKGGNKMKVIAPRGYIVP